MDKTSIKDLLVSNFPDLPQSNWETLNEYLYDLLNERLSMDLSTEYLQFPPADPHTYLVIKGTVTLMYSFPIKVIIKAETYPHEPAMIFLDMPLSYSVVQSKKYLGQYNQIQLNSSLFTDLVSLVNDCEAILSKDPPLET